MSSEKTKRKKSRKYAFTTASCPAGCCGLESTDGCEFSSDGRTCKEFACSAGAPLTNDDTTTCFEGGTPTLDQLKSTWTSVSCPSIYSDILNDSSSGATYNPENLARIQADTNHLLTVYTTDYGKDFTNSVTSNKYDPFQKDLIQMCSDTRLPGACDLFLQNYCSAKDPKIIASDPVLNQMCGCYSVGNECSSGCNLSITVKRPVDTTTGEVQKCQSSVCVINDVTINQVGGSMKKQPAFYQVCPSCTTESPCSCSISGVSVTGTITNSGLTGAEFIQVCNPTTTTCYNTTASGGQTQVTCPAESAFPEGDDSSSTFWVVTISIIFLVILFIFIIFFMTKHSKHEELDQSLREKGFDPEAGVGAHGGEQNDWTYI